MRTQAIPIRLAFAALLALLLGVRLLAPAGFMPAFNRGAVIIIPCPDGEGAAMPTHHHFDHRAFHVACPYAAAASLSALGPDWTPPLSAVDFAAPLLLGWTFLSVERKDTRDRPPAIGPPGID